MEIKPRPNQRMYLQVLRQMTPEQRLRKAFELTEFSKALFMEGLRRRFPDLPDSRLKDVLRERIDKCHNRNY